MSGRRPGSSGFRRSRGSSPRAWRRSRSVSRDRRRSPRRSRRTLSGSPERRHPGMRPRSRSRRSPSSPRQRTRRSDRSPNVLIVDPNPYEQFNSYEPPPPTMIQRFSPPPVDIQQVDMQRVDMQQFDAMEEIVTYSTPQQHSHDVVPPSYENIETLPEFDPEHSQLTAREWTKLVSVIAQKKNWTKEEKKYHMSQKLVGVGRQWYLTTNRSDTPWNVLRNQFIAAFPSDMDFYKLLSNMMERKKKKEESYATYITDKVGLLENCGITGLKAISCIIGGLPHSKIRDKAFSSHFKTVDSLYEYLRESEKQEVATATPAVKTPPVGTPKSTNHLQSTYGVNRRPIKKNVVSNKNNAKINPKNKMIMFGALGKAAIIDKYFTDVQVNGTLFRGYIDFKSTVCTIREETANFAGLDYQRCYESVMGFNGYTVSSIGQVKAAIAVDQGLAIVDVYICPNHIQAIPVVVGQNFLRRPDILVMQDKKSINIYQQGENPNFPGRGLPSYPYAMQGH